MKRTITSIMACLAVVFSTRAQTQQSVEVPPGRVTKAQMVRSQKGLSPVKKSTSSTTTIWSEDFANGIPADWINQGYDLDPVTLNPTANPLCLWEYRGPNTSPNRNVGSRGAWAAGTGAISSPTRTNGFLIFDSDYLDNSGSQTNPGSGVSPAPHIGTLTTDTIDLTGYPNVEIAFYSHCRQYSSEFHLAVSNDGGLTYPDTFSFHEEVTLNNVSRNPVEMSANISAVAGNQPNVVIQFIFDGSLEAITAAGSAWGYYYWQIDDIEIRELPEYSVHFVEYQDAPAHDLIYPSGYATYGHVNLEQAQPLSFDANLFNYGSKDLTNVKLVVEVQDADNGTSVATLSSPVTASLSSQDTLSFTDLTTTSSWTPSNTGNFNIIFSVESDSIPVTHDSYTPMDTFTLRVTDEGISDGRYSFDWRSADNFVGTDNLAVGSMIALGERFNFPAPAKDTAGFVFLEGMTVFFDSDTDPNSSVIWEVYDTAGFAYGATGGPLGTPYFQRSYSLNSNAPGSSQKFNFYDTLPNGDAKPLVLPSGGAYYFIMNMLPNTPGGVIRVANDQSFDNPPFSIAAQADNGSWFAGFNNSDNLSAPIFRLSVAATPSYDIGLKAYELQNQVKVFPNPAQADNLNIQIANKGAYQLKLYDIKGTLVHQEQLESEEGEIIHRQFSQLPTGIYMLHVSNEKAISRHKIVIK
jgi:hypothetical protein